MPGRRVVLDAHNCYPEHGEYADRLERALATGLPVAIEQDLAWYRDPTGRGRSILSHGEPYTGAEPGMKEYLFEKVRPAVEGALRGDDRSAWPLITVNLDFKTAEREHLEAVWALLGEYESWLTTAPKVADERRVQDLAVGPLLVLSGCSDEQKAVFHDVVPLGARLRVFGCVPVEVPAWFHRQPFADWERAWRLATTAPRELIPTGATNYRRWVNFSWTAVELGGASRGGRWRDAERQRLAELVRTAHQKGLWIRTYTLNGHLPEEAQGWSKDYNFGSPEAVGRRWQAAIQAGVDFLPTDQYEELGALIRKGRKGAPARE